MPRPRRELIRQVSSVHDSSPVGRRQRKAFSKPTNSKRDARNANAGTTALAAAERTGFPTPSRRPLPPTPGGRQCVIPTTTSRPNRSTRRMPALRRLLIAGCATTTDAGVAVRSRDGFRGGGCEAHAWDTGDSHQERPERWMTPHPPRSRRRRRTRRQYGPSQNQSHPAATASSTCTTAGTAHSHPHGRKPSAPWTATLDRPNPLDSTERNHMSINPDIFAKTPTWRSTNDQH